MIENNTLEVKVIEVCGWRCKLWLLLYVIVRTIIYPYLPPMHPTKKIIKDVATGLKIKNTECN